MANAGLETLIFIQAGAESAWGTGVSATTIIPGITKCAHDFVPTNLYPKTYAGDMAETHDRIQPGKIGDIRLEGFLGFENFEYFAGLVMKKATPATDGGTPPAYSYANTPAITSEDTAAQPLTLEIGHNGVNYQYVGCLGSQFGFSWKTNDLTPFNCTVWAKNASAQAKTAALTLFTVEPLLGNYWVPYIDNASGGTIGTTAWTGGVIDGSFKCDGFTSFKICDGTNLVSTYHQLPLNPMIEMTVVDDDACRTLKSTYHQVQGASALIRLQQIGSVIHDAITKRVRVDGCYFLDQCGPANDQAQTNVNLQKLTWRGRKDPGSALVHKIEVVHALSALP